MDIRFVPFVFSFRGGGNNHMSVNMCKWFFSKTHAIQQKRGETLPKQNVFHSTLAIYLSMLAIKGLKPYSRNIKPLAT